MATTLALQAFPVNVAQAVVVPDTVEKVTVCHATGSENNPYVKQEVNVSSIVNPGGGGVNVGDIIPSFWYEPKGKPGQDPEYYSGKNWDKKGQDIWDKDCVVEVEDEPKDPEPTTFTLSATKIICDDAADLPQRSGGADITGATATEFLDGNDNCRLEEDWQFQWIAGQFPASELDDNAGELSDWNPFKGSMTVEIDGFSRISVREVMKADYLPFSGENTSGAPSGPTAEFWCHTDVLNYDNLEYIDVEAGGEYHCVAFNVKEGEPEIDDARISPILECVIDKGEGVYEAHFSYETHNTVPVTIEEGTDNKLTGNIISGSPVTEFAFPAPNYPSEDRMGRTGFFPHNAFAVVFEGGNLVWTLTGPDGATRTATAGADSTKCEVEEEPTEEIVVCKLDADENPVPGWEMTITETGGLPSSIGRLSSVALFVGDDTDVFKPVLTVSEYTSETQTGTTEEDGCVSFTVPAGTTWEVTEAERHGWEFVSVILEGANITADEKVQVCRFGTKDDSSMIKLLDVSPEYIDTDESVCTFTNRKTATEDDEPETDPTPTPTTTGTRQSGNAANASGAPAPQVLGEAVSAEEAVVQCEPLLHTYLRRGTTNDQLETYKLQAFLAALGYGDVSLLTGVFDRATDEAVRAFQLDHQAEVLTPWYEAGIVPHNNPTGWVYRTTRWKINNIYCPGSEEWPGLEDAQ